MDVCIRLTDPARADSVKPWPSVVAVGGGSTLCHWVLLWLATASLPFPGISARAQTVAAQTVYEAAEKAIAEGRLEDAAKGYELLAGHSPSLPEVHAKLGWIHYQMGSFTKASDAFTRALELRPGMPTAETLRAICQSELGQFEQAIPVLEKRFRDPPDPSLARMVGLELQRGYLGLKRNHDAAAMALELSRRYPDDPEILYYSGRLFGDFSFLTMQKLSDVADSSVWARLASAEAYETREKYELAIIEYRNVLKVEPGRAGIRFRIGRILRYDMQPRPPLDEAMREFRAELQLDPSNASAAYELGEALRVMGNSNEARGYFEQAIHHYPAYREPRIGLARVLISAKRPGEAIQHLERAISLDSGSETPYYLLAQAYRELGDEGRAQEELQRFLRIRSQK